MKIASRANGNFVIKKKTGADSIPVVYKSPNTNTGMAVCFWWWMSLPDRESVTVFRNKYLWAFGILHIASTKDKVVGEEAVRVHE